MNWKSSILVTLLLAVGAASGRAQSLSASGLDRHDLSRAHICGAVLEAAGAMLPHYDAFETVGFRPDLPGAGEVIDLGQVTGYDGRPFHVSSGPQLLDPRELVADPRVYDCLTGTGGSPPQKPVQNECPTGTGEVPGCRYRKTMLLSAPVFSQSGEAALFLVGMYNGPLDGATMYRVIVFEHGAWRSHMEWTLVVS